MTTQSTLLQMSEAMADLAAAIAPTVVQVLGRRRPVSGLMFDNGAVLTTARAIGREEGLDVKTHDGRTLDAELAGWDPATELAVLRVNGLEIEPAHQAGAAVRVGQLAVAVARSWSNALTVSMGNIAVIGGPLRTGRHRVIEEVIRTTAPMHDGFAGGPLVSAGGEVLGISTAAAIRGFTVVIPAAIAWKTGAELLSHGSPKRGFVGIAGQQVHLTGPQRLQIDRDSALLVLGVTPGSPAEAAGILVGDIVTAFDGSPVRSAEDLLDLLHGDRAGRTVAMDVLRGDSRRQLTIAIGQKQTPGR